MIRSIVGS